MKNYILLVVVVLLFNSCNSDDDNLSDPSDIQNISVTPKIGGALLQWDLPTDSSFTYIEINYLKNNKLVVEKISKYTDSALIDGLINKEPLDFKVRVVNESSRDRKEGEIFKTEMITPIKRSPDVTYYPNDLSKLDVNAQMLDTYTQETSEGYKENLVDGDPATFWHTAWSSGVQPLPHWIQINFASPTDLGAFKFYFRQNNGDVGGRPSQWGLEVSENGQDWDRVWVSQPNLPVADNTFEYTINFDKNYNSKYFRVLILANEGRTYTHLGEIAFFSMKTEITDKESEAEEEYYNF